MTIPVLADPAAIQAAARLIHHGKAVAFPTETVYGLGADAFNARACAQIFAIKQRPSFDPLIVHLSGLDALTQVAATVPPLALELAKRFWPGPLTLVLPRHANIPDIVSAGLPTVAVRVPDHPVALALLQASGTPLAAPSANPFGRLSPTEAAHVETQLGDAVPMILDGGPCRVGVESTIVDLSGPEPVLLRPGGLAVEEIEKITGPLKRGAAVLEKPLAPGQLASHYAPRTPLKLLSPDAKAIAAGRGLLAFKETLPGYAAVEILSPAGDPVEAATRLFACLHRLDALGLPGIDAQLAPEAGLGLAINDRLRKAAA
jgi:L-threonylcarbamoyladenylate synthase